LKNFQPKSKLSLVLAAELSAESSACAWPR
jgi:hypothetical protein